MLNHCNYKTKLALIIILHILIVLTARAQNAASFIPDTVIRKETARQIDLIDIGKALFHIRPKVVRTQTDKNFTFQYSRKQLRPWGNGRALVTSTMAAIFLWPQKTTNLSSATFTPYWNFGRRFGLPLRNNTWLPDNAYTI